MKKHGIKLTDAEWNLHKAIMRSRHPEISDETLQIIPCIARTVEAATRAVKGIVSNLTSVNTYYVGVRGWYCRIGTVVNEQKREYKGYESSSDNHETEAVALCDCLLQYLIQTGQIEG